MSDLISRQDALMEARPEYLNPQQQRLASYNQGWNDAVDEYYDGIESLPSAEPKTGEWIEHEWAEEHDGLLISNYECTNCHLWERNNTAYCPNCGADMGRQ